MSTSIFAKLRAVLPSPFLWLMLAPHLIKIYPGVWQKDHWCSIPLMLKPHTICNLSLAVKNLKTDGCSPGCQEEGSATIPAYDIGKLSH